MRASILALEDLSPRDIEGWRTLAAEAAEPNPFFEPEYVLPAAELIGGRRMALLVVRASAGWAACLPIHRPRRWHRVPARAIATWQHRYCFLGTPLVRADGIESAVGEMTRELMRQRTAAFVGFDSLCDEGPVREALRASVEEEGGEELRVDVHERAALRRRATAQDYLTLKAKHRHELARKRRRLEEAARRRARDVGSSAGGRGCRRVPGAGGVRLEGTGRHGPGLGGARCPILPHGVPILSGARPPPPALARSEWRAGRDGLQRARWGGHLLPQDRLRRALATLLSRRSADARTPVVVPPRGQRGLDGLVC